VVFFLSNFQYA